MLEILNEAEAFVKLEKEQIERLKQKRLEGGLT